MRAPFRDPIDPKGPMENSPQRPKRYCLRFGTLDKIYVQSVLRTKDAQGIFLLLGEAEDAY